MSQLSMWKQFSCDAEVKQQAPAVVQDASAAFYDKQQQFMSYEVVEQALALLRTMLREPGQEMSSARVVKDFLTLRMALLEHEVFGMLLLDAQHRVLSVHDLHRGTLSQTAVYPREVAKTALMENACAVILYHNHPSGVPEPSAADDAITQAIKSSLALLDVQVLDHIIVAGVRSYSYAERGRL